MCRAELGVIDKNLNIVSERGLGRIIGVVCSEDTQLCIAEI